MMEPPHRGLADAWYGYAPGDATFATDEPRVHVWRIRLDDLVGDVGDILSADELARAERFSRDDDRRRFTAARSVLRSLLANVIGRSDRDGAGAGLRFGYGPAGKPFLIDDPQLHFNVSHSDDLALIAVTRAGEVGIDVEKQRDMGDLENVARLVFDEAELAAVLGSHQGERHGVFYRIWTRKEALLKARGLGLSAVSDLHAASLSRAGEAWSVTSLPHLSGYAAALARPRHAHEPTLWSWPNTATLRGGGSSAWLATSRPGRR